MKKKLRRSGTAWVFLLSLLFALPVAFTKPFGVSAGREAL